MFLHLPCPGGREGARKQQTDVYENRRTYVYENRRTSRCLRKQTAQQMLLSQTIETDGRQAGATPGRFFCLLWLPPYNHYCSETNVNGTTVVEPGSDKGMDKGGCGSRPTGK